MNTAPNNPALVDRLAAEYVLGTLRGPARARLERWRASSALVDERCRFWEQRLLPLLRGLKAAKPPAHVWRGIQQRLGLGVSGTRRGGLRSFALAASILVVLAVGAVMIWRMAAPGRPAEVATIGAPQGALMWQVEVYGPAGAAQRLSVRAGALASAPTGRDYELWALPKGGKPVSLGLLPYAARTVKRDLTPAQRDALASAAQLAVSVEPPGGSPTGQPTGAVVFVAALQAVS